MKCSKCGRENAYYIHVHSIDENAIGSKTQNQITFFLTHKVKDMIGIDFLEFMVCLDCGNIQGKFPHKKFCKCCKEELPSGHVSNICDVCQEETDVSENFPLDLSGKFDEYDIEL